MKLQVADIDGPDFLKAELVMHAVIMLDGVRQIGVVMADEENGVIERFAIDDKGFYYVSEDGEGLATETIYGCVVIKDERDEYE